MKKILGLDVGTNSIGWALINWDDESFEGYIIDMGSRILPTDTELLSKYEAGQAASKNALRRTARGARRLRQRYALRRERLIDVLKILKWLPDNFKIGDQFQISQVTLNEMKELLGTEKITQDWIVYYLRHKALTDKIELHELARILYHMNQRRGFKSNRKANNDTTIADEIGYDSKPKREKKIEIVTVDKVEDTGNISKGRKVFNIHLSDGRIGTHERKDIPDWTGQQIELEITTIPATKKELVRYEFRLPIKSDWQKLKESREEDVKKSGLYIGSYYFNKLTQDKNYVIKDVPVDRKFYVDEIETILAIQAKYYPTLLNHPAINAIASKLYPHNADKQKEICNNNITHLLLKDIIYFQRPLKSQKHNIADCRFEKRNYRGVDGKLQGIKTAPTSSLDFQEFRIWQTINNLKIICRENRSIDGKLQVDLDVTSSFLNVEILGQIFLLFDGKEKVSQKQILKILGDLDEKKYYINYYRGNEEKELPGNETKAIIRRLLKKAALDTNSINNILDDREKIQKLWHILYSLDEEQHIYKTVQKQFGFSQHIANVIAKAPAFKQQYASLSSKAINKLLPLMRAGQYWKWDSIDTKSQQRIQNIINGEFDEGISNVVRELLKEKSLEIETDFQGLPMPIAAYIIYGINSEKDSVYFDKPEQIQVLKATELRNPTVTQVTNETLRVIRDIWAKYGRPYQIHLELAREIKKNAKERAELSKQMGENEKENQRIASILRELKEIGDNPYSLSDIERLKLWEKQSDEFAKERFKDIKFRRPTEPTRDEINKYKIWCEQKHLSPYSGKPIPMSDLFTSKYQVDHIMPRSRYFDDSIDNKVVVESHLNKEKDNRTAYQYIKDGSVKGYEILNLADYEALVSRLFFRKKKRLLLSQDVPDSFISRQLNDTKYINRKLNELLSPIAENRKDPVIVTNGTITSELRQRWGLSDKMKMLVRWRFERLQEKTGEQLVSEENELQDERPTGRKILKLQGYEKRIDHRHHALDALVIACTTRKHIKYLNTLNAQSNNGELKQELEYLLLKKGDKTATRKFQLPWNNFVDDAVKNLRGTVISFNNTVHLFGNKKNKYQAFEQQADGTWVKKWKTQDVKKSSGVRQSLHKATFAGKINLREYKPVSLSDSLKTPALIADGSIKKKILRLIEQYKGNIKDILNVLKTNPIMDSEGNAINKIKLIEFNPYYVNRVSLDNTFDQKKINKIPDRDGLAKDLLAHLKNYNNDANSAFDAEGIERFNKNRNQPVYKVRIKEESTSKFEISKGKWVEADKGTNLFYVIYEKTDNPSDRIFLTIPLRDVIEAKKNNSDFIIPREGYKYTLLSPNDLVYMPDENENIKAIDWLRDKAEISRKVYKMVSSNKTEAYFIPHTVSKTIKKGVEFESNDKIGRSLDGRMIKQFCIKLKTTRLGHIEPA